MTMMVMVVKDEMIAYCNFPPYHVSFLSFFFFCLFFTACRNFKTSELVVIYSHFYHFLIYVYTHFMHECTHCTLQSQLAFSCLHFLCVSSSFFVYIRVQRLLNIHIVHFFTIDFYDAIYLAICNVIMNGPS